VIDTRSAVAFVAAELTARSDPVAAVGMAQYMKTDMPFYGVKKPGRAPVFRELRRRWRPQTRADYEALVSALWEQPHREEKYFAIGVARESPEFITSVSLPLYRRLIVEGAWWDFVDEVAAHLVGRVLLDERPGTSRLLRQWIADADLWLRRTAIISQLTHKGATDAAMLFEFCAARAHESEFFIRKAIGWALREYAKTDPESVRKFVASHHDELSGLSRREALKHL
jgi:3-methyladenine DNA glycosylase AlkD